MERKKILYWCIQFAGWTTYFLLSILLLYSTDDLILTFRLFLFAGLSILSTVVISHGIRFAILSRSIISKNLFQIISITLLLSIAGAFILEGLQFLFEKNIEIDYVNDAPKDDILHYLVENYIQNDYVSAIPETESFRPMIDEYIATEYVNNKPADELFNLPAFLFGVSRSIILFLLWCGFYFAFVIAEKSRAQEILNLKWEASKNEIELKNLRAQLNPHFLFNSLNSIRALVELNPSQAKTSITQLSNLLRQSINLGRMRVIPLSDELNLVKTYLDLEQVRFEEHLFANFDIQSEALTCEIPPLLIQTVVENAIKHGIARSVGGGTITITAQLDNDLLTVKVANTGQLIETKDEAGIGIKNSKKRLYILYGKKATFKISQEDDQVVVNIKIKYQ